MGYPIGALVSLENIKIADNLPDELNVTDPAEEFKFQINNYDGEFVQAFLLDHHSIY